MRPADNRQFSLKAGLISRSLWQMTGIHSGTRLGRLLRLPLKFIPAETEISVLGGPMKGIRWIAGSSNATCWMGVYEHRKQNALQTILRPGHIFFDLGANVGFYTLLGSRLVGDRGRVVAFEPAKRNISYLRRHLEINKIMNCDVFSNAVSSRNGTAFFEASNLPVTGHLSQRRAQPGYEVQAVTLDHLTASKVIPGPNVVKCDIEGGEYEALVGAQHSLQKYRPVILLATHGPEVHALCCRLLRDLKYRLASLSESVDVSASDELVAYPE